MGVSAMPERVLEPVAIRSEAASSETLATYCRANASVLGLAVVLGAAFAWPALTGLFAFWSGDQDYSHGFLVPLAALWAIWSEREALSRVAVRRSLLGSAIVVASALVILLGHATRTRSMLGAGVWGLLAGSTLHLFGWNVSSRLRFPLLYLLFAVPLPQKLLGPIRLELKELATRASTDLLQILGYDASARGNVLIVGTQPFEVADACSGIRSLVAIAATAVLFARVFDTGIARGAVLLALSIPITVLVNVLRVVTIAVASSSFGIDLSSGFVHDLLGYVVFASSLALLYGAWATIEWLFPSEKPLEPAATKVELRG
jgi:exosortase